MVYLYFDQSWVYLFHIYDKSFFIQSNDDLEIWNEERDTQMYDILANFKF